ncbi:MAG: hypothetical protein ACUVQC_00400 [Thermaceae bacterium]
MFGLSLLPWGLFLLGLYPLYQGVLLGCPSCSEGRLERGLYTVLEAVVLAGVGSLFSRLPLGPKTRTLLVLGLGLLALERGYEGSLLLTGIPFPQAPWGGILGGIALILSFLQATGNEAPFLPPLAQYTLPTGLMQKEALSLLEGSLEGLAWRRPLFLLYLVTEAPPGALARLLRARDLAFEMGQGEYLVLLQQASPQEALGLLERLKTHLPLKAFAIERWQGERLKTVLQRLQAEIALRSS